MKALCFEKNDRLNLTEYTQAALVTTCLAMEKVTFAFVVITFPNPGLFTAASIFP